jgi:hypothetical protein
MTYANRHLLRSLFWALLAGVIIGFVVEKWLP